MTVSSNRGIDYDIDDIVLQAFQQCGIMGLMEGVTHPMWEAYSSFGRKRLDAIINELPTSGGIALATEFYDLTLTSDTYRYSLPAYTLAVNGDGMFMDSSVTDTTKADSESIVKQIGRDQWHALSSKDGTGDPTMVYIHRAASPIQAWFWPIPDDTGSTVRLPLHRVSTSAAAGTNTLELRGYWTQYLVYELAFTIALSQSLPAEKYRPLGDKASALRKRAVAYSMDHTGSQIMVDHGRRC